MNTNLLNDLRWDIILLIAVATFSILFMYFRIEKKARWISLVFLLIPFCAGIYRMSKWNMQLSALGNTEIGIFTGLVLFSIWHLIYGRNIPLPNSNTIKVWGQDD